MPGTMTTDQFMALSRDDQIKFTNAARLRASTQIRKTHMPDLDAPSPQVDADLSALRASRQEPPKFGEPGYDPSFLQQAGQVAKSFAMQGPFVGVGQKVAEAVNPTGADIGGFGGAIAGGAKGAAIGAVAVPGPIGMAIGGIAGSVIGAVAGGAAGELADQAVGDNPFNTVKVMKEGIKQGLYEVLGAGASGVLRGGVKLIRGRPLVGAIAASEELTRLAGDINESALAAGRDVTPEMMELSRGFNTMGELLEGGLIRTLEEATASSAFAGALPKKAVAQEDMAIKMVDWMHRNLGKVIPKGEVSKRVFASWERARMKTMNHVGPLYDSIGKRLETEVVEDVTIRPGGLDVLGVGRPDQVVTTATKLVKGTGKTAGMVDMRGVTSPLKDLKQVMQELNDIGLELPGGSIITDNMDKVLGDKRVSWNTAKEFRTALAEMEERLAATGGHASRARRVELVRQKLTDKMGDAVRAFDRANPSNAPLTPIWEYTDNFYAEAQEQMGNATMRGWMRLAEDMGAGPQLVDGLLDPQNIDRISAVVKSLDNTSDQVMLRRWHMESLKNKSLVGGKFVPEKYLEALGNETQGFGREALEALHGKDAVDAMFDIAKNLKTVRGVKGSGGSFAMRLMEMGPVLQLFVGGGAGAAAGGVAGGAAGLGLGAIAGAGTALLKIGITVKAMNRLMANGKMARDLATLASYSPRDQRAVAAGARIMGALSREDLQDNVKGRKVAMQQIIADKERQKRLDEAR